MSLPGTILITGTDTGVGKTITTAALAAVLEQRGGSVAVYKPCQSGNAAGDSDCAEIQRLAAPAKAEAGIVLEQPLAPVPAAALDGVTLPPLEHHAARIRELGRTHSHVLVEGAGGLLVELDPDGGTLAGLGSLGVMSAFVQWGLPAWLLQTWSIANPVEAYRLAGIVILDPETTALGPVGDSLLDSAGRNGVIALAAGSLVGWAAGAFVLGLSAFRSLERGFPTSSHGPRPTDGMVAPGSTLALVDERVKLEGGRRR